VILTTLVDVVETAVATSTDVLGRTIAVVLLTILSYVVVLYVK